MSARITAHPVYIQIVAEHLTKAAQLKNAVPSPAKTTSGGRDIGDALSRHYAIVIVFAAMSLEAYIFDYATRRISDTFVRNHLERMDVVSKYVVVPQLVTGRPVDRSKEWFALLKQLVRTRNELTHYKSQPIPTRPAEVAAFQERIRKREDRFRDAAQKVPLLFASLASELQALDPQETLHLQVFHILSQ